MGKLKFFFLISKTERGKEKLKKKKKKKKKKKLKKMKKSEILNNFPSSS